MENLAAHVARQLLIRWGIVAYEHFARDAYRVPWRYVVWALRSLEARGEVIGGRFIEGLAGEQFAHPRALDQLTHEVTHSCVTLSASDHLNLSGDFLDSERIAARAGNSLLLSEGVLSAV
jgi:ATP-dependent Lhr-like helicase